MDVIVTFRRKAVRHTVDEGFHPNKSPKVSERTRGPDVVVQCEFFEIDYSSEVDLVWCRGVP
jgi:hypothetical protein